MEIFLNTICAVSIGYAAYIVVALIAHVARSVRQDCVGVRFDSSISDLSTIGQESAKRG